MKIEDRRKDTYKTFEELYIGDAFESEDMDEGVWVKCGDEVALNLNDDYVDDVHPTCPVRCVKVRVVIED